MIAKRTIGGRTMVDFDKTEYDKGDVLVQIGRTEKWTVIEDDGFFYTLERGSGYASIRVDVAKCRVNENYIKVDDILNEAGDGE